MQRKRAQLRRVEILDATVEQIESNGMAALRISDVATALGVSPALIVYHFDSKENLLAGALRHAAERDLLKLRRIVKPSTTAARRLMEALRWYVPTGHARGWILWIDGWAEALWNTEIAEVFTDLQAQWTETIAGLIDEGTADGTFDAADGQGAATRITALLDGLAVRMLVHDGRLSRGVLTDWLTQQVAWELGVDAEALTDA